MVEVPLLAVAVFAIGIILDEDGMIFWCLFSPIANLRTPTVAIGVIQARLF